MYANDTIEQSPFIEIPNWLLFSLKAYIIVYVILDPLISELIYGPVAPMSGVRLFLGILQSFLLYLPLLFFNRNSYGFFHPLIFPVLIVLLKQFAVDPIGSLTPLEGPAVKDVENVALLGWSQSDLSYVVVWGDILKITSLLFFYLGFFYGPRLGSNFFVRKDIDKDKLGFWFSTAILLSLGVFVFYLITRGSLTNLLLSWSGRSSNLLEVRALFPFIRIGFIVVLMWFAVDKNVIHSLTYWAFFVTCLAAIFLVTGSRSTVVYNLIFFGAIWILHFKKVPTIMVMAGVFVGVIFIGVTGLIRASTWTGTVDTTVLTDFSVERAIESSNAEIASRSTIKDGFLPVVAKVPDDVDLLLGKSYVASIFFFVPRIIWEDKPRGAGIYNKQLIFGGTGGGIPPGDVGEVYWNFHLPGIIIIYFLLGVFFNWAGRTYVQTQSPIVFVPYVITIFTLSPEGTAITAWLQQIMPLMFIVYALDLVKRYDPST